MKNLFDSATVADVKERLARLTPESARLWGKMSPAQAMAHCAASMEWAVGDTNPPQMFIGRIVGQFVKPILLRDEEPMRRNAPTAKSLVIQGDRDLGTERARLCALIDRFAKGGTAACTQRPHCFFGRMKPEEWAILMYKHLDHHLRQFSA